MIRILLADDQHLVRGALSALLSLEDDLTVVAEVGRGDDVVPAALEHRLDVAVLDVEMPGEDGIAAAAHLRVDLPTCRVLVVTTFGRPGYLRRAMEAGASGFMVKDAPADRLADAIRRVHAGLRVVDPVLAAESLAAGENPLTAREREVLAVARDGGTVADVAAALFLSEGTVRNHLSSAIGKTGSRTRAEAARIAHKSGRIVRMGPRPLVLGDRAVWPPVVLAPMAGITNVAFRRLCREYGAGLYVSEMVTTRALVERDRESMRMVAFAAEESPRSLQLYGVDPGVVGRAVRMVADENLADHVDLNFGCPVPKVTRKGGGSALPYKRRLFGSIVSAAVDAADGRLPVTVKMRKGIDEQHLTYLDAGRIAQDAGAAWVALHGRTAAQLYSGRADWDAIGALKAALDIPVLGNGDIWEAADAVRMRERTGCDGVVVGRGCLGRPWLFGDLAAAFDGRPGDVARPGLAQVAAVMRRHAELLAEALGDEGRGCRDFRKHVAWYLKGFRVGSAARQALAMVGSLDELDVLLAGLELAQGFPDVVLGSPRGRTTGVRQVSLPDRWLEDPEDVLVPVGAELASSGG